MKACLALGDVATIENKSGVNSAGEDSYSSPVTVRCRFDRVTKYSRTPDANTAITDGEFIFNNDVVIAKGDRVSCEGYIGTAIEVTPINDLNGTQYSMQVLTRSK